MPDLKVIQGGGGGGHDDLDAQVAREAFERLVIELLRAVARGEDWGGRVSNALVEFINLARETKHPLLRVIHEAVERLFDRALDSDRLAERPDSYEAERRYLLRAALRVAAEGMATDPAAKGRRSKRMDALEQAIKEILLESERRSRASGWSYSQDLIRRLGEWPPPEEPKPRSSRQPRRK